MGKKSKRGIEMEILAWWIIGIFVLVVAIIAIILLKGKGISAVDYIKNLFRFGR